MRLYSAPFVKIFPLVITTADILGLKNVVCNILHHYTITSSTCVHLYSTAGHVHAQMCLSYQLFSYTHHSKLAATCSSKDFCGTKNVCHGDY